MRSLRLRPFRLSDDSQPVDRLDMRVAGAICQVCAIPLSDWIVFEEEGALRALLPEKQTRLDILMTRNNAGSLTDPERSELHSLVREAEDLILANARFLAQQRQRLEPVSARADRAA